MKYNCGLVSSAGWCTEGPHPPARDYTATFDALRLIPEDQPLAPPVLHSRGGSENYARVPLPIGVECQVFSK